MPEQNPPYLPRGRVLFLSEESTRFAWGAGLQVTSSPAERVLLPLEGKDNMPLKLGEASYYRAPLLTIDC